MTSTQADEMALTKALINAERLMRIGKWTQAESILREYCPIQADLTLRLAQLHMRRACVEYASSIDIASMTYAQALHELERETDYYSAIWTLKEYGKE